MKNENIPSFFPHQKKSIAFGEKLERFLDLSDPGTMKTRVHLEIFARRRRRKGGCALVLCPRTLMKTAWGNDIKKFVPDMSYSIAYADKREKYFDTSADVYITNVDATNWLKKQKPAFFKRFDSLIVDEITKFKHHTSARSRALNHIKKHFKYRSGLTGTPNTKTICDLWHPMYILDDGKRLGHSFYAFRSHTCIPEQVGPSPNMVKWVDKDGAEEAVFGLLADMTIRHEFDEVMKHVPPMESFTIEYDLPDKQMKSYREMERAQIMFLEGLKGKVTAINAAAVRTKLLQIASGAVYENPEQYHVIDTGRYELTMDLAEQRKHPLVFFLWKHQRDKLVEEAKARKLKYCVFDGNASDKQREEMERAYQAGFYDMMFAHPESTAHGLTLTKGTSIIWPSPTDNLEWWAQGNRRQRRGTQTEKTEVIVILAPSTVETKVYGNLLAKNARMDNFLDLFAEAA